MSVSQRAPKLKPEQYAENFAEIHPALTMQEAHAEASRCLYCYDAPCTIACPTHIDIPSFIKKIASDNLKGSARVILDANPMGHSCARACPVEVLCEGSCVMNALQRRPIDIAGLQRVATDAQLANKWRLFQPGKSTGKKVAIVGAGPAGLSAAQDLRRNGHAVTIFEAKSKPGGLNTYGLAQYKITPDVALAEVQTILDLGVELKLNTEIGRDLSISELTKNFDAVFIAVGLGETQRLGIPGENLPGVVDALTFIEELKMRPYSEVEVGRNVVVIGAGNTAIDAVTQAKRLGAESSTIVYRRAQEQMPAYAYEYELAKKDGCEFRFLTAPVRVIGDGAVTGLQCVRMTLGAPDESGRQKPEPISGSEFTIPADMVILALGQVARETLLASIPGVAMQRGALHVDEQTGQTANPKVFAGGDCVSGGADLVNAAAEGKRAAAGIHAYLTQNS